MFQQEEATDAEPERGSCHTSEAATTACPAPGEPGLWSGVPQAQPAAKSSLASTCNVERELLAPLQAELKHTGWAKPCWGAGACQYLSWLHMEARDSVHLQLVQC